MQDFLGELEMLSFHSLFEARCSLDMDEQVLVSVRT